MRNLDEQLKKKREEIYGPLIRKFEERVNALNIPKNELDAVPSLFIPQFGELVRIEYFRRINERERVSYIEKHCME
jgi:hypothetical protein